MKNIFLLLVLGLAITAAGCAADANCKPCKFNSDEQKVNQSMNKIDPQPQANPPK